MRHLATAIIVLGLLLPALRAEATLSVVTTTTDTAAIARAVGGAAVNVEPLLPGTRDPHYAEAKPSMIRKIYSADLVIAIGAELEIAWLPAALQSGRNGDVLPGSRGYLDLAPTVTLLEVPTGPISRAMGDVHRLGNPHYWLDPRNGLVMAQAIAARLGELDPQNAAGYRQRLAAFEDGLNAKLAKWSADLAPLAGAKLVSYHSSFTYLAAAYGFDIIDRIEPIAGIAPTASHTASLIERMRTESVAAILLEPYRDRRPADYLSEATGAPVVMVPQSVGAADGIETYFDLFDAIVASFRTAGAI